MTIPAVDTAQQEHRHPRSGDRIEQAVTIVAAVRGNAGRPDRRDGLQEVSCVSTAFQTGGKPGKPSDLSPNGNKTSLS